MAVDSGRTFLLDPLTWDLDISGGTMHVGTRLEQSIAIRLKSVAGEWFRDRTSGIPYRELIWVKSPRMAHINTLFRETVARTAGVREILQFRVTLNKRQRRLNVSFSVAANDSTVVTSNLVV
jgi:hypothetical protein